jgi:hypothetical protein
MSNRSFAALLFFAAGLVAQAPAPPVPPAPAAAVTIAAGATTVRDVIDRAAAVLGRNILLDEMELTIQPDAGAITLAAPVTIDALHGEEVLAGLLVQNGFVLTEVDAARGLYEAIALRGPRHRLAASRAPLRSAAEVQARPGLQMPVMVTFRLQHVTAMPVAAALRTHFAAAAKKSMPCTFAVTPDPSLIVLLGLQADVAERLHLVRAADVPTEGAFVLAAGDHELPALVARAAEFLQWTIRLDPDQLRGVTTKVHLQHALSLNRFGCEDTLASLLASRGLVLGVTDAATDRYEVTAAVEPGAKGAFERATQRSPADVLARPALQVPVKTTYRLQHADALMAVTMLRPFVASLSTAGGLRIGPGEAPQEVTLVGMQAEVALALRLLMAADVASPNAK